MHGNTAYFRIGLIGAGEMGSGVGGWLAAHGVDVRTTLAGRSPASAERVQRAGIGTVEDLAAVARTCRLILSIVPPDRALEVAEGFAAVVTPGAEAAVYVDCNAVAPETVRAIGEVIASAGLRFVDAGIVGGPPRSGYDGPQHLRVRPRRSGVRSAQRVRPARAQARRTHRPRVGDEDVLRRIDQRDHRDRVRDVRLRRTCRRERSAEGGVLGQPAGSSTPG